MARRRNLGVRLICVLSTALPVWLRCPGVTITFQRRRGQIVQVIEIPEAEEAYFVPGGSVAVTFIGGSKNLDRIAFRDGRVLEIRSLHGRLLSRN